MTCTRPEPGFVIAATGLVTEARIAARAGRVRAVAGGGDSARLSALIEEAIAEGGRGIISFGIAGGLAGRTQDSAPRGSWRGRRLAMGAPIPPLPGPTHARLRC